MDTQTAYYRYWDKSKDDSWHCLPYHCLDVGAVGLTLLEKHDPIREQLIKLTGLSRHDFMQWAVFLLVLHDVGKFSVTFRNVRSDLLSNLQGRKTQKIGGHDGRHDTSGFALWKNLLAKLLQNRGLLTLGSQRHTTAQSRAIDYWMAAMTGHHGSPPRGRTSGDEQLI